MNGGVGIVVLLKMNVYPSSIVVLQKPSHATCSLLVLQHQE